MMYTLRFPFRLPIDRKISFNRSLEKLGFDNLTFQFLHEADYYVLLIDGFETAGDAKKFLNKMWSGFAWILLHKGLPVDMNLVTSRVVYFENPREAASNLKKKIGLDKGDRVDGAVDGAKPAIYKTDKQLLIETPGRMNAILTTTSKIFLSLFAEGVAFPKANSIININKLRIAFELYGAYFKEVSDNARFLTLIMALEALAEGVPKTQLVLNLLEKWQEEVDSLTSQVEPDSEDAHSLDSIRRELFFRREDSLRRQIRRLVKETLEINNDKQAKEKARLAVALYDKRSVLVHEGKLPKQTLQKAIEDARELVQEILKIRFLLHAQDLNSVNIKSGR